MGLFRTMFGVGQKLFRPLMSIGQKAYTGLRGIGNKIASFFTRRPARTFSTEYKGTKYTQKVADMFKEQRASAPPSISGQGVGGYTAKGGGFQYLPPRQPVDLLSKTPFKDTVVGLDF
tara:strand:+ start:1651 stop:2004 length:354 start_codon:yes stop_codon:yes gene_type:complete